MSSEDFEIEESLIGREVILAFTAIYPTPQGPDFVKIAVTIKKIFPGSIVVESKDPAGLSEITIPKSRIQFISKSSNIATVNLKLPSSFRA